MVLSVYNKGSMSQKGFTLVEILVAISIILVLALVLASVFQFSGVLARKSLDRAIAVTLAEEGIEVAKLWRDTSWDTYIATKVAETPYYLSFTAGQWQAGTSANWLFDRFERVVVFTPVYRNGSQDLSSSGTIDTGSRLVSTTVSWWDGQATSTYNLSALITDQFNN